MLKNNKEAKTFHTVSVTVYIRTVPFHGTLVFQISTPEFVATYAFSSFNLQSFKYCINKLSLNSFNTLTVL